MKSKKKICHISFGGHSRTDTRIYDKQLLSLKQEYENLIYVFNEDGEPENSEGINLYPLNTKKFSKLRKIFFIFFKLKNILLDFDYDIYHFHDEILMLTALALKKKHKKIIFDLHEDTYQIIKTNKNLSMLQKKILLFFYSRFQKLVISKLDYIITTSPSLNKKIKIINKRSDVIFNYPKYMPIQKKIKSNSEKVIIFAGSISEYYNIKNFLMAIENFEVKVKLFGPINDEYLEELKKIPAWDKVIYYGVVPQTVVFENYLVADIGVALLSKSGQCGDYGCMGINKLFEYMLYKIPYVVSNAIYYKEITEKINCGFSVDPNNIYEISDALKMLIIDYDLSIQMGSNGHEAVKNKYNWASQEKILFNIYRTL